VDLPFRDDYEDYMDVVLLAKAWFAICCSTGPLGPAIALGTTVLLVNGILEQQTFFNPRDVIQFKRYIDDTTGLPIPYRDFLDRGIAGYSIASELEQNNVHLEENSREEILSAVQEMETRWGGTFDADPLLDAKFRAINEEFLARLEARHPETGGTEPSERNFGLAVPWTTVCQRFCQDNPWFL
jgi:putative glycosyltransferase (TIGR04372 family)